MERATWQSWVIHDAAMNERLQIISDILLTVKICVSFYCCKNGLDIGCGAGSTTRRRLHKKLGKEGHVTINIRGLKSDIISVTWKTTKLYQVARSHSESNGLHFFLAG